MVDGPVLVADALASDLTVTEVFAAADALPPELPLDPAIDVFVVEESVLSSVLDPVTPRPLAAVVCRRGWALADLAVDRPVLVAVELRDPGNLGTIVRTAEAAGLAGVTVVGASVDPWHPKVVRASAGSILRTPVVTIDDTEGAFDRLRAQGREVVVSVLDPSAPAYDEIDLSGAAIVVGNEPHGLTDEVVDMADQVVTIPMASGVESLNVGAASAVLCFEAARRRRHRSEAAKLVGPDSDEPSL